MGFVGLKIVGIVGFSYKSIKTFLFLPGVGISNLSNKPILVEQGTTQNKNKDTKLIIIHE